MVERGPAGLALPREVSSSCPEGAAATCVSPLGTLGRWPLSGQAQARSAGQMGPGWTESASLLTPVPGVRGVSEGRAVAWRGWAGASWWPERQGVRRRPSAGLGAVTAQPWGSAGLPQGTGAGIGSREALCPLTPGPRDPCRGLLRAILELGPRALDTGHLLRGGKGVPRSPAAPLGL